MDQNHKMALATATRARLLALQCVHEAASGHPGGSMSCMDLLTVLCWPSWWKPMTKK